MYENGNIFEGFDIYIPYSAILGIVRVSTPVLIGYSIAKFKKEKEKEKSQNNSENNRSWEGIKYALEICTILLFGTCSVPYLGQINVSKWNNCLFDIFMLCFILSLVLIIAINEKKAKW